MRQASLESLGSSTGVAFAAAAGNRAVRSTRASRPAASSLMSQPHRDPAASSMDLLGGGHCIEIGTSPTG
jgi:hypothetical protein